MNLEHYPEELASLFDKIIALLSERGVASGKISKAAFSITERIRHEWGGMNIFLPSPVCRRKHFKDVSRTESDDSLVNDRHGMLAAWASEIFTNLGLDPDLGVAVADMVSIDWGGASVYVGKGMKWKRALRDHSIWKEWDGSCAKRMELIKRHGISDVRFYMIIREQNKKRAYLRRCGRPDQDDSDR